jgi:Hint domain
MADHEWIKAGSGDWGLDTNWTPTGVPGLVPTAGDAAILISAPGVVSSFTVTIGSGEVFGLAALDLTSTDVGDQVDLDIGGGGKLTTDNLLLTALAGNEDHLNINNGGILNIVTSIGSDVHETLNIEATGVTGGGRLELGSATSSGINVNNSRVTFRFLNNAPGEQNDGVVEYLSGYKSGVSARQIFTGVGWGETFIFDGATFTGDTVTHTGTTLTVKNLGGTTVLTMVSVTATAGTTFIATGDEIIAVCYARGTMIATASGELPVEKLRPGKQVITLADGQEVPQTVTWLGHLRIGLAGHPRPETVAPIRIRRDAFADGMPHRDLIVSPDHAIFVDGKLICARQLVNGATIRQELDWTAVDYYHVELDQHAILLAEGLPAESYIDTGNSGFFANSGAPMTLHPDLTEETDYPAREASSCAPFVWDEASVRPEWQKLADRAAALGQPVSQRTTTTDADLRLLAKYRTVKPIYSDGTLVIFNVPRGASEARLLSRAQSPTEARPWLDDRRRLGVCVKGMVLRGVDELHEIPVDHPGLTQGWWAVERDGQIMSRWTDGEAVLALPAMRGTVMLEIHLAGSMTYVVDAVPEGGIERRTAA